MQAAICRYPRLGIYPANHSPRLCTAFRDSIFLHRALHLSLPRGWDHERGWHRHSRANLNAKKDIFRAAGALARFETASLWGIS